MGVVCIRQPFSRVADSGRRAREARKLRGSGRGAARSYHSFPSPPDEKYVLHHHSSQRDHHLSQRVGSLKAPEAWKNRRPPTCRPTHRGMSPTRFPPILIHRSFGLPEARCKPSTPQSTETGLPGTRGVTLCYSSIACCTHIPYLPYYSSTYAPQWKNRMKTFVTRYVGPFALTNEKTQKGGTCSKDGNKKPKRHRTASNYPNTVFVRRDVKK